MIPYTVRFNGTLGSVTTSLVTLISGSVRSFMLVEIDMHGQGTASAPAEIGLYRIGTAGVSPSNAVGFTPIPAPNMTGTTPALAFSGSGYLSYGTQPIKGALVRSFGINANGQRYYWRAMPNFLDAIPVPGGANAAGSIGAFPISGTGVIVVGQMTLVEL